MKHGDQIRIVVMLILVVGLLLLLQCATIIFIHEEVIEEEKIQNINLPLKLIEQGIGNNNIYFTYEWRGNYESMRIYASEFDFVNVYYSNIIEISNFVLLYEDTLTINHIAKNELSFTNWHGQHKLYLIDEKGNKYVYYGGVN